MRTRNLNLLILLMMALLIFTLPAGASLKIGILPDADSIPLIVAREEGLFAESGFEIELVNFHNPIERDSALQAGVIDGAISDVLAAAFAVDRDHPVKITSLTNGRYVILAAPNSEVSQLSDLNGQIAISSNTIIEYVTDLLLKEKGAGKNLQKVAIPKIPVRLQMLEAGKIKAACLPEPLASVVQLKGAIKVGDSTELGEAPGIILFKQEALTEKQQEIAAFYSAYSKAVELINDHADQYRELLVSKGGFPAEIRDTFVFPVYDQPKLPAETTVQGVLDWLNQKELLENRITYQDLITDKYIK